MKKLDAISALSLSNIVIYAKEQCVDEKWWNAFCRVLIQTKDRNKAIATANTESGIK